MILTPFKDGAYHAQMPNVERYPDVTKCQPPFWTSLELCCSIHTDTHLDPIRSMIQATIVNNAVHTGLHPLFHPIPFPFTKDSTNETKFTHRDYCSRSSLQLCTFSIQGQRRNYVCSSSRLSQKYDHQAMLGNISRCNGTIRLKCSNNKSTTR